MLDSFLRPDERLGQSYFANIDRCFYRCSCLGPATRVRDVARQRFIALSRCSGLPQVNIEGYLQLSESSVGLTLAILGRAF